MLLPKNDAVFAGEAAGSFRLFVNSFREANLQVFTINLNDAEWTIVQDAREWIKLIQDNNVVIGLEQEEYLTWGDESLDCLGSAIASVKVYDPSLGDIRVVRDVEI